jgi:hypothetical protein
MGDLRRVRLRSGTGCHDALSAQELSARVAAGRPWRVTGEQLVAGRDELGLLVNTEAVHADRPWNYPDFQGAFFAPLDLKSRLGELSRILGPDSQFRDAAATRDGGFLVAGEDPLTVVAVGPAGQVLWRRPLGSGLVLPSIAIFDDGSSCLAAALIGVASASATMYVFRLDAGGEVTRQISIPASPGAVAAEPSGVCAVLFRRARQRALFLAGFDASLRRLWMTRTPLAGGPGAPCQLAGVAGGYLALGREKDASDRAILAKFNSSGKRLWSHSPLPPGAKALAAWGSGAVYLLSWGGAHAPGAQSASFRVTKIH